MPGFLVSELPVQATARQHGLVVVRLPSRPWVVAWVVLAVVGWFAKNPVGWAAVLAFLGAIWLRWRAWKHDRIYLTGKRIVRLEGLPETTEIEAWMRLDRISGMRMERTAMGRVLGYATIVLEAPGNHPATRELEKIARPMFFYGVLRKLVLDGPSSPDPDDSGGEPGSYVTAPLPAVTPQPDGQTARLDPVRDDRPRRTGGPRHRSR